MRVQRAHNREGRFSTFSDPPKSGCGVGPSPGSAVLQLVVVWQAKKAVAEKQAAEEAEKVPSSPHRIDAVSVALRETRAHALSGDIVFIHTRVRCVGPPRVRWRVRVRTAGRWRRLRVRSHCCSRSQ
jgi:hypothetical protein